MGRDRRSQRRLTFRGGSVPSCSPGSREIAFVRRGDLYTIAINGKRLHRLTRLSFGPSASGAYRTAYAPDGRRIAFLVESDNGDGADYTLEVVNLRGRRAGRSMVLASSGPQDNPTSGGAAGISWQPLASRPRARCVVPDVLGMGAATATARLKAAHCAPGNVTSGIGSGNTARLVVGAESPALGSLESKGTRVGLVLVGVPSIVTEPDRRAKPVQIVPPGLANSAAGVNLDAIACASSSQCITVGGVPEVGFGVGGEATEVTFDPAAPAAAKTTMIDPANTLFDVACPSLGQCTTIGDPGELTFDPRSPRSRSFRLLPGGTGGEGLACASTTQCTVIPGDGTELTFNPRSPGTASQTTLSGRGLLSIACPTTTQCTAVGDETEVTFNPRSHTTASRMTLDRGLVGVNCPTIQQCTAVDHHGGEVTFDPASPGGATVVPVDTAGAANGGPLSVACPASRVCTLVDSDGREVTFDPTSPTAPGSVRARLTGIQLDTSPGPAGIACPSTAQCTIVASTKEVTFNPQSSGPLP